jgi:hypothetical protein
MRSLGGWKLFGEKFDMHFSGAVGAARLRHHGRTSNGGQSYGHVYYVHIKEN